MPPRRLAGMVAKAVPQAYMPPLPIAMALPHKKAYGITPLYSQSMTAGGGGPRVRVGDVAGCGAVIIQGSPTSAVG